MHQLLNYIRSTSLKNRIFFGLSIFCPIAFISKYIFSDNPTLIFCTAILAIIPLAAFSTEATESVAQYCGNFFGGFLNSGLGNIAELIFTIVALRKGLINVVKASILGAVTSNVCVGVGLALFFGGLRFKEQTFGEKLAGINAASLTCLTIVILCPSALKISLGSHVMSTTIMRRFSYVSAIILFVLGIVNIIFAWKTHSYLYTADIKRKTITKRRQQAALSMMALDQTPSPLNTPPAPTNNKLTKIYLLIKDISTLILTTILIVCLCQFIVDSLEGAIEKLHISSSFTAAIILPLVSSIIEFVTCISCALKNKIELTIAVTQNSTSQILCFIAPITLAASNLIFYTKSNGEANILLDFDFKSFDLISTIFSVAICNSVLNGNSNWMQGIQLLLAYGTIATGFFYMPF
ncbi:unnamed protein product [Adineta steineri]|uniref:Sodium/calcium exchanger membrane region domain-containing protein n=1 Tax=Adineta steineri TaxID=433720 RepID=A0A815E1U0_9BILA|nr:unnamed protein product [Adineta steineri]